jgi:hypothetical protein
VAILGRKSKNGRVYSDRALQSAARVYEGSRVYVNHNFGADRGQPRDVTQYVGRVDGLFVDGDIVRAAEFTVCNENFWPLVASIGRDPRAFGSFGIFFPRGAWTSLRIPRR